MKQIILLQLLLLSFVCTGQSPLTKTKLDSKHTIRKYSASPKPASITPIPGNANSPSPTKNQQGIPANWPFSKMPHQHAHLNCQHQNGFCDPRNLPLSTNGKLLSVDGYEVDFRTSGKPGVTTICGTPRGYIDNHQNKSAGCSFRVACDDPANRDAAPTTVKYFQLIWHVMQSSSGGASSNINQTRIDDLMAELNADYASHNMIFCADPATFYVDDVNYSHDVNTEEVSLKTTYNVNPTQLINIYVVGTMTPGGYARFPYDPMGGTSPTGGIVMNRGNCNVGTHTLAHEMGHTFGLEHTFAGVDERGSCTACYEQVRNANGSSNSSGAPTPLGGPYTTEGDQEGDWCSDTNPHDTYSYNCFTSSNPNGACDSNPWNNAPVNNHMSYSFCSSQFSDQQSRRMHCMSATYLNSWISYGGGICGTQPPVADFDATPTSWIAPSVVNFNDLSQPTAIISTWTWTFDAAASNSVTCAGCTGANATFVGQTPPAVTYPNPGLYTVALTVTSPNGNDTETKVEYIEVLAPAGDCDTLDIYWTNPALSSPTAWGGLAAGEHLFILPDQSNSPGLGAAGVKGVYERYITPNPGVTKVGAVRVGLGSLTDPDDDMVFQIVIYDDNAGEPGVLLGGVGGISPTNLGVPAAGFFQEFWIPLPAAVTPTTANFHVGLEAFPGDATDELVVIASANGEGQGNGLNHIFSTGFGYENVQAVYGIDIDLDLIPMLGEYTPSPLLAYSEVVNCDTTFVTYFNSTLYSDSVSSSFTFSDGTVLNSGDADNIITKAYTTAGPETITIATVNECGRADTVIYTIPYNFMSTPDADFTKNPQNPICNGVPGVNFTANTNGYSDYTWTFGDGTPPVSTAGTNTVNHVYTNPGLYQVTLNVTSLGYQPSDTFYLEDFEAGWPAGYQRFNNDIFVPNAAFNPPFTGSDATAWLPIDIDGSGDLEAISTSWNGPGQQADDWMLTTGIGPLPANQILSWDAEALDATFADGYEVRISTTQLPANTTNYGTLLYSIGAENAFNTTRTINLAAYAGQTVFIAFRNNSTDEFLLSIDNIRVGTLGQGCSNTEQKIDFVEIIDCTVRPPSAALNATPTAGCAPLDVQFTDATTAGDAATSWVWNFGDGTFSTLQNPPLHTYTAAGSYFVIFQACNSGGCSTDTITIFVGSGVTANAGLNQAICADQTTLTANDPSPGTGLWTIVSGSGTFANATQFNSTVSNLGPGNNVFEWTITGSGCVSSAQVTINAKSYKYALNGETSNSYCTDANGWNHFFNSSNEILLSVRGDLSGADPGYPLITINDNGSYFQQSQGPFTAPSCASGLTPGEERFEMERSWNLDLGPSSVSIPPYDLRFYYQPAERTAIETAAANWISTYASCSYTYKYPNPLGFYWFKNTGSNYTAPDYDGVQHTGTIGNISGINYGEWSGITSFSGGSGAIILTPDPLLKTEWLYFDGVSNNKINYLRWATESEEQCDYFNLQRSKDGQSFENIASIATLGGAQTNQYSFDDEYPFAGENYYRLELINNDGSKEYSNTVLLLISEDNLDYVFYPNPSKGLVFYQFESEGNESIRFEVVDVLGRIVHQQKNTSSNGINKIPVSLHQFAIGSYMIRVFNETSGRVHTTKIIKTVP